MSVEVIHGTTGKPAAADALAKAVRGQGDFTGRLVIGYPILPTPQGRHPVDALLVSDRHGVVAFDLIESDSISGFEERQDDTANNLDAQAANVPQTDEMKGRSLRVPIGTIFFAPRANPGLWHDAENDEYRVANDSSLNSALDPLDWPRSLRRRTVLPRFSVVQIPYAVAFRLPTPYMLGVRSRRLFWRADS